MADYINEQEYKEKLGKYIMNMCTRIGIYSEKELAEKLDVSTAIVSNWKYGIKMPSYLSSIRMAALFGVSLDEFYEAKDIYEVNDKKPLKLIHGNSKAFNNLKKNRKKELIREYIKYRQKMNNMILDICNCKTINEDEFKSLYKIVDMATIVDLTSSHDRSYTAYLIEKIDKDFKWENVTKEVIEKSSLNNKECMDSGYELVNVEEANKGGVFYTDIINENSEINKYFTFFYSGNENGMPGFFAIDCNGNRAFVRQETFMLISFDLFGGNYIIPTIKRKINDIEKYSKKKVILNDLLITSTNSNFNPNVLNDYVKVLLFNYEYVDLLDDYIKSLSILEKHLLLCNYIDECEKLNQKAKVEVLYKFLSNGTKIVGNFNLFEIEYESEKTYELTKVVMEKIYNHKEEVSIDEIPSFC